MLSYVIAFFSLLSLLSCGLAVAPPGSSGNLAVEEIPIEPSPHASDPKRFGSLTFLSGFELRSSDRRFGGLSGLVLSPDGSQLHAVSDRGYWVSILVRHDAQGRLISLGAMEIFPLLTPEGSEVKGRERDAEALVWDRDGSLIVSFEQVHRLWRYPPPPDAFHSLPQPIPTPAELASAPSNGGLEAMTVLPDGRILAITETYKNPDGSLKGWLIEKDQFISLSYLLVEEFRPTDLAALSNGDVLLLESRFGLLSGWAARIVRIPRESLLPGARLIGEEIARIEPPLVVDNFEGMAVREDPQAGTLIYLVSDDNYSPFQRTLVLQFRLGTARGN